MTPAPATGRTVRGGRAWSGCPSHRGKVTGTVDGAPLRTSFMALGDGRHKLPVTAAILTATGKAVGDVVEVLLTERR